MTTKIKASVVGYVTAMTAGTISLTSDTANTPNLGTLQFGNGTGVKITAGDGNAFTITGGVLTISDTTGYVTGTSKGALVVNGAGWVDKDLRVGQNSSGINGTQYIQVNNAYSAANGTQVAATVAAAAGGGYALMQSLGAYSSVDPATSRFAGYSANGVRIIDAIGDNIKFGVNPNHENGNYSVIIKTSGTVASSKDAGGTLQVKGDAAVTGDVWATYFRGTATAAQYGDVAEKYLSDANYEPGTVVSFGGDKEITITIGVMDSAVAGVISTNPAYMMNSELKDGLYVALIGRVPCRVIGKIQKGDLMVSSGIHGVATAWTNVNDTLTPGSVIGKALENYDDPVNAGVIEVVVGRG
jgi:hypothetical protein